MHRHLWVPLCLAFTSTAYARGLVIPMEPDLPPLAMLNHHVQVVLEDQVGVTTVEQTFRNHTDRKLEASYVFPVPRGAGVRDFSMWVNGREMQGELLQAQQATDMYTELVRQTQNPGLLENLGADMLRLKVFPVPPNGDLKVKLSYTSLARKENDLVEYIYPLKTDRGATSTLEEFRLALTIKSQQPIGNLYSPTHEVTISRPSDHEAAVSFERKQSALDRDFRLFYTTGGQDFELTSLAHRPISAEDGYVMLLLSPRAELPKDKKLPRDIVFVLDTSGSMAEDGKMDQAKKALRHCLGELSPEDRFGLVQFATTVNNFRSELSPAGEQQLKEANRWVDALGPGGGTAIHHALSSALEMRGDDPGRLFTVVFFTDGQPTIGEREPDRILAKLSRKYTSNTRIFCFGVGDDLNAVLLDQIAEQTRSACRYVRPGDNLEQNVAGFFDKINRPVLANLKLTAGDDTRLTDVFPPQLPDLFHGDQLVVLARYQGGGKGNVTLAGDFGGIAKEFTYELEFPVQTEEKTFVEELSARRKVGYLLDQIRVGGEQEELVEEVIKLARHYGITTPYTSYLITPDVPLEVVTNTSGKAPSVAFFATPAALAPASGLPGGPQVKLEEYARAVQGAGGGIAKGRGDFQDRAFDEAEKQAEGDPRATAGDDGDKDGRFAGLERLAEAKKLKGTLDQANANFEQGQWRRNQVKTLGVDLAVCTNDLKRQSQLTANAVRRVAERNCLEIGGVWIDEAFTPATPALAVKAQSDAYFRILARQPQMKEVFQLGNHVLWVAPSGQALVIDTTDGKEKLSDREIDALFAAR